MNNRLLDSIDVLVLAEDILEFLEGQSIEFPAPDTFIERLEEFLLTKLENIT